MYPIEKTRHEGRSLRRYLYSPGESYPQELSSDYDYPKRGSQGAIPETGRGGYQDVPGASHTENALVRFLNMARYKKHVVTRSELSEGDLRGLSSKRLLELSETELRSLEDKISLIRADVLIDMTEGQWEALTEHQKQLVNLRRYDFVSQILGGMPLADFVEVLGQWSSIEVSRVKKENYPLYQLCLEKITDHLRKKNSSSTLTGPDELPNMIQFGGDWYAMGAFGLRCAEDKNQLAKKVGFELKLRGSLEKERYSSFMRILSAADRREAKQFLREMPEATIRQVRDSDPEVFEACQNHLGSPLPQKWLKRPGPEQPFLLPI